MTERQSEALERLNRGIQESRQEVQKRTMNLAQEYFDESAEALTALYANTWLSNAASAGAAAMSGGALTAFELLCDNALMDYIRAAKLRSFGAAHVSAYLAAMENETTAARMILTGRLAGLQPAVIRERLRETYA